MDSLVLPLLLSSMLAFGVRLPTDDITIPVQS